MKKLIWFQDGKAFLKLPENSELFFNIASEKNVFSVGLGGQSLGVYQTETEALGKLIKLSEFVLENEEEFRM